MINFEWLVNTDKFRSLEYQEPKVKEYVLLEDVVSLLNVWQADELINQFLSIESSLRKSLKVKEIDDEGTERGRSRRKTAQKGEEKW